MTANRYVAGWQPLREGIVKKCLNDPPTSERPPPPRSQTSATRPRAEYRNEYGQDINVTANVVIETDEPPRWSGLYDQFGQPLYHAPVRVPMGFQSVNTRNAR